MKFRNCTPFDAMAWSAESVGRDEFHVVAVKVGYRLVPMAKSNSTAHTHDCQILEGRDSPKLVVEDRYFGDSLLSSIREESDLAPFKPCCDVLINATAHAPGGEATAQWPVRVRIRHPSDSTVLLDKQLLVSGARWFERINGGWVLSDSEPTREVPIRWEYAYGGTSHVPEVGLHQACFTNPIGRGWTEARYFSALERADQAIPSQLPAPQIEALNRPVTSLDIVDQADNVQDARQMAEAVKLYSSMPAGLGAIGRAWTPRLQYAGTYDEAWTRDQWPHLPSDFDFAYWNAAPADQQIERLPPDAEIELVNLVAPEDAPEGVLRMALPGHRAFVLLRLDDGALVPLMMILDTLLIDAESLHIDVVWRAAFPRALNVRVAEARFELDQSAPIVRFGGFSNIALNR